MKKKLHKKASPKEFSSYIVLTLFLLVCTLFLIVLFLGKSQDIRQNAFSVYPTPTIAINPLCKIELKDGSIKTLTTGACGCNIPGYEKKMCIGNNRMVLRGSLCDAQCYPVKPGATCDELAEPDPECIGKKEKDACGALKGFTCEVVNAFPPAYCGCVMNMN